MANTATVTAKAGPGLTATAVVLNNVTDLDFQMSRFIVQITGDGYRAEFDTYNTVTVTYTIASRNGTVTIAQ